MNMNNIHKPIHTYVRTHFSCEAEAQHILHTYIHRYINAMSMYFM